MKPTDLNTTRILYVLQGASDCLREASKSFRINNPNAHVPNLFDLHADQVDEEIDNVNRFVSEFKEYQKRTKGAQNDLPRN